MDGAKISQNRLFAAALILVLYVPVCYAQSTPRSIPPSAEVGKIQKPIPLEKNIPELKDKIKTRQKAIAPNVPLEVASRQFVFRDLTLSGMTAFDQEEIKQIYEENLGHTITVARLFDILTEIQQLYQDEGYTLSKVIMPPQDIKDGHIIFQFVEGHVTQVDIDPLLIKSAFLQAVVQKILQMRPLDVLYLERLMLLLNDRPGLNVTSVLSNIDDNPEETGAVKLTIKSVYRPEFVTGFANANNFGSNFIGPIQITTGANIQRGLPNESSLNIYAARASSASDMRQIGADYNLPILGASGTLLSFSGNWTRIEPDDKLDDLDILGHSLNLSTSINYPLIRQRDQSLILTLGFDYKNATTDILMSRLFADRIRSVNTGMTYAFSDGWRGLNSIGLNVGKGLDIFGARKTGSEELSRGEGHSDFVKYEISALRMQSITDDIDIVASLKGQYANSPLLSSEEFGFGGPTQGRGYDTGELSGDHGVGLSLELHHKDMLPTLLPDAEGYVFYDIGKVWNIDPSDNYRRTAASAGAGLRFELPYAISLNAMVAIPLTKSVDSPPNYANGHSPRYLFSLSHTF